MNIILKNQTANVVPIVDVGNDEVPESGQLNVDPAKFDLYARSNDVMTLLSAGTLVFNNGTMDVTDANTAMRVIMGGLSQVKIESQPAFADKVLPSGGKIYVRDWGEMYSVTQHDWTATDPVDAPDQLILQVPFPHVKLDELEIIGGETGDRVSFHVWNDTAGTYNGAPANYPFNQFGFMAGVAPGYFRKKSKYDADLYYGMQIVIDYYSMSAKTIFVNYGFNEVK